MCQYIEMREETKIIFQRGVLLKNLSLRIRGLYKPQKSNVYLLVWEVGSYGAMYLASECWQ
jgi:hypothetical protein